ncbi:aminoglycoside phosphotransferase family protein [Kribbella sp. NPDC026596]|uniref:aminoglycoside phosphotransferase family protein n=1 Tax=Kribbella sp. NPDC026596 TaxID=3155122 RepID=UPI0033D7FCDB
MSNRAQELADAWGLDLDPMTRQYGDWNQILFVHRGRTPYVLKLVGDGHSAADEATALRVWDGHGAVLLVDEAPGALLLERLDPNLSLSNLRLTEALPVYANVLRQLSVPAPSGPPSLATLAANMAQLPDLPPEVLPPHHVALVRSLAAELASDDPGNTLVHGDLHSGNILAGDRQPWLAIDPKPAAGHPERALAELFWTRIDEMDDIPATVTHLASSANLNAERARAWVIVRAASYLVWAVNAGLTQDPVRCRRLIKSLA